MIHRDRLEFLAVCSQNFWFRDANSTQIQKALSLSTMLAKEIFTVLYILFYQ